MKYLYIAFATVTFIATSGCQKSETKLTNTSNNNNGNTQSPIEGWEKIVVDDQLSDNESYVYEIIPDNAGNIYLSIGNSKYIHKWDGSKWTKLGQPANSAINGIVIDSRNNVYVRDLYSNYQNQGYIVKWDGSAWQPMGRDSFVAWSIAIDNSDHIFAGTMPALLSNSGMPSKVVEWDGNIWKDLPSPVEGQGTSVMRDSRGNIYALSHESLQYTAWKWNGSGWTKLAALPYVDGASTSHLIIDTRNDMYVTIIPLDDKYHSYLMKWNGASWERVVLPLQGLITDICEDIRGYMYIIVNNYTPTILQWDGSKWGQLGRLEVPGELSEINTDAAGTIYVGSLPEASSKVNIYKYKK